MTSQPRQSFGLNTRRCIPRMGPACVGRNAGALSAPQTRASFSPGQTGGTGSRVAAAPETTTPAWDPATLPLSRRRNSLGSSPLHPVRLGPVRAHAGPARSSILRVAPHPALPGAQLHGAGRRRWAARRGRSLQRAWWGPGGRRNSICPGRTTFPVPPTQVEKAGSAGPGPATTLSRSKEDMVEASFRNHSGSCILAAPAAAWTLGTSSPEPGSPSIQGPDRIQNPTPEAGKDGARSSPGPTRQGQRRLPVGPSFQGWRGRQNGGLPRSEQPYRPGRWRKGCRSRSRDLPSAWNWFLLRLSACGCSCALVTPQAPAVPSPGCLPAPSFCHPHQGAASEPFWGYRGGCTHSMLCTEEQAVGADATCPAGSSSPSKADPAPGERGVTEVDWGEAAPSPMPAHSMAPPLPARALGTAFHGAPRI
ncbi:PREDICTED: LOW QUALITY PROTEIN: collagen alpha-2(XI) chain-like [Colobus angolensis palliatus]|uniref:LOW QUALITY PROTEIN: collagen alpha-2(XI) chain-like n=1 Tax=Colobus angolensis palliatus TaxID=336983 RepID=UPI0005F57927|nr:PREDICTED: LOW QUALITY PROTEIN: collagen alpha-2(XI) chain-like [Colobus angolensis palliatus]